MKRLKDCRLEKHLTQKELAQILNITQQTYSDYETGRTNPDLKTLCLIADVLAVSIDYLLGREDDFGNVATPGAELPADEQELLTNFRTLPREEKVQARSYVRYLAERRAPGNKHA